MRKFSLGFLLSTAALCHLLLATAHAQTNAPVFQPPPPATPPTPPAEVPAPEPPVLPPPQPLVRRLPIVTLLANSPETVLQEGEGRDWDMVCRDRCGKRQDPTKQYRVGGRGLIPSEPFELPSSTDQVEIKARMGSKAARIGGTFVGIGGLGAFALNGFVYIAAGDGQKFDRGPLVIGMVLGGLGAAIGLLMAATANTSVEVHNHLSPPAPVQ